MNKKYELTGEKILHKGRCLTRIKALKDFGEVKKGDLGGFIEKEANLSHEDHCWVYGDAYVYGDAHVFGNAQVYGTAKIDGCGRIRA